MATVYPKPRNSRQRQAIADLLADSPGFLSAQEVFELLRAAGHSTGLATVYRGLQALAEAGLADVIRRPDGDMVYRKCSKTHHHHLICNKCGLTIEISASQVEQWARNVANEHGFSQVDHDVELTGVCATCSQT